MSNVTPSRNQPDAVALLKADHRAAEALFQKFESARTHGSMRAIADQVCDALTVHAALEEEIFYPACRAAGVTESLMNEALVEHEGAKALIRQIRSGDGSDPLWQAKVTVLSEQIAHHVKEEEQATTGMFSRARAAGLDLDGLGAALAARKHELTR